MTKTAALPENHPKIQGVMVKCHLNVIIFCPPTIFSAILIIALFLSLLTQIALSLLLRATSGADYLRALRTRQCAFSSELALY